MEGFHRFEAIAAPLALDMVDTDQIFPSRFMRRDRRDGGFADFFLHDLRFDANGAVRREFILNDPRLADAGILVASGVYGVGSGRPGAVLSHLDYGIRAVIAEGFGPVFSAVAYKSGLLTIELGSKVVTALRAEIESDLGVSLIIDLDAELVLSPGGIEAPFPIDPFVKRIVSEGLSEVELTLAKRPEIEEIENRQRALLPWLFEVPAG